MKKITSMLVFMAFSLLAVAQPAFTEKTVQDMAKRFEANPLKYLNEEIDPTFTLMGAQGQPLGYDIFKGWYSTPGFKMNEWSVADLKVQQLGKTAIVMGIKTHIISVRDTVVSRGVERFTYLFEFKNGKWLWTYGQHTPILKPAADEEAAIKKLLVEERKAYFAGDKGIEKFWKNDPKTIIQTSYTTGSYGAIDNERRKTFVSKFTPGGSGNTGTITSSKVKVYGNVAVADVEITTNYKNGSEAKERNMIVLEKNGDDWQIVNYSLHGLPKDKNAEEAAIKAVIEKETQAWKDRDAEAQIACLANVPHSLLLVYHGNMDSNKGVAYSTNEKTTLPESIRTRTASMAKADGSTFKNENYVIAIKGGAAFVTFDQVDTAADGKKQYLHEVRNLEKFEGFWKITYVGAVVYTPN
jgi:hypothetical protein